MYLPDYIDGHLSLFRDNFARAWFGANWGYEESKHALTLWRYLVKSGHRTEEQMRDYSDRILVEEVEASRSRTAAQMTAYGCVQEMTTFVIYKKQQQLAEAEGNDVLADVYKLIAKDEMAHAQYYRPSSRTTSTTTARARSRTSATSSTTSPCRRTTWCPTTTRASR